jgi:hypothetical protein
MVNARGIARLGVLAVGLGIGAVVASGNVNADSSTDWLASLDSLLGGVPASAADTAPLNLAISIDGTTVFQEGSAQASSGTDGDIAIANGAGASATATGTDNYADVDGTDSSAVAGGAGGSDDTAFAFGNDDTAFAGGTAADPGTFDGSVIFGNDDGAYSGGDAAGPGSYDVAYVEGNDLGTANAMGQDYFVDILKVYGDTTTTTAESTSLLPDATSGAAETANLADLLSSLGDGAASSGGNLLTDLASLF